ncbi:protein kinase [Agaribacterium sp. ZY112]|uniref:protein kinase domain-containing protein n=1 Tax=Agaribacterium sp. ZY112 TaxID=3233574 RepID=UPI00352541F3
MDDKTKFSPKQTQPESTDDKTVFAHNKPPTPPAAQPQDPSHVPASAGDDATVFAPRQPTAPQQPAVPSNPDATVFAPRPNPTASQTGQHHTQQNSGQAGAQFGAPTQVASSPTQGFGSTDPEANSDVSAAGNKVIKGRFELVSLLGVGGMGAVYKALDRRKVEASDSDPYVAVKLLNDDFRQHPDAFISLQRESRKSQTLAHPNIVTAHDFDRDNDMVFMTMEFLEGAPLDALLREYPHGLENEEAMTILKGISNALIYAHSHNIVHSDFKPGNIFVTEGKSGEGKGAKVFDFGIARAVSEGNAAHSGGEKTVFDAGTLGALTPAYASYEMLKGKEPSPSDDLFALACVAYELFCGSHPYGKVPADQAFDKKLKPKRLKGLSRRQWKALSKALELKREQRTETIEEFYEAFFGKPKILLWLLLGSVVAFLAAGLVYMELYSDQAEAEKELKAEMQQQMADKLKTAEIDNQKATLERFVKLATLTPEWDQDVSKVLDGYSQLAPADGDTPKSVKNRIGRLYLDKAGRLIEDNDLDAVAPVLAAAISWGASPEQAAVLEERVESLKEAERLRKENARLAAEKEEADRLAAERRKREAALAASREQSIDNELTALEKALRCRSGVDVAGAVATHLGALERLDSARAPQLREAVAGELVTCFNRLALKSPYSAEKVLQQSRLLLPEQVALKSLKVDYCSHLKPGTGGKGRRYTCQDRLPGGQKGPSLVVVPSPSDKPIAIAKFETSYNDVALFCQATAKCDARKYSGNSMPVHNVDFAFAKAYAQWLTKMTGNTYRLPSRSEWLLSAKAKGEAEPSNRNCHLKYGGIEKGGELYKTTVGEANSYGLMNAAGNVREWVMQGDQLKVAGGSRKTPINNCRYTSLESHSGKADELTGFRLVRELNR